MTLSQGLKTLGLLLIVTFFLSSCATGPTPTYSPAADTSGAPSARSKSAAGAMAPMAEAQKSRPGLGTGWGKKKSSKIGYASFTRASNTPYGKIDSLYYNDEEGVDAMAGHYRWGRKGLQKSSNGLVEWGVKQGTGVLKSYYTGGKRFIEGKKDKTYAIVIKNVCNSRLEAVVSVDGLDVLNGRAASTSNNGYVINPGDTLTIKGFRTSKEAVAAFKFSGVSSSYSAEKHGTTRNVGVIGLALFAEKGNDPWNWNKNELEDRNSASPFAEAASR